MKASGSNTAASTEKIKPEPLQSPGCPQPPPCCVSHMVGHSTGSGLWITFRNTQVVYFCSGQWWDFTPALTEVRTVSPNFKIMSEIDTRGIIITSPGETVDFVSRFFAPRFGIDEDPVTGSAHCVLTPFWAERLGKDALTARQISSRGGDLKCKLAGSRVSIIGHAVQYMEAEIAIAP